jgi:hypothetical protein
MAISAYAYDNAVWTFPEDVQMVRGPDGGFVQQRTEIPWAFVQFADGSEANRYWVPTNGTTMQFFGQIVPRYFSSEIMPYLPFPVESSRPARTSDPRDAINAGGPIAVNFVSWI